tara:strand:- start:24 stop:1568 length:1545 start_codon:yes stop_codon:yes gene_type:complete
MSLPAAEIMNETMWVVYYEINKKSQTFVIRGNEINVEFWVNAFSGKDKLSGSLKKLGINLSGLKEEISDIDSKVNDKDALKFFGGTKTASGWHEALKQQVQKFSKNPATSSLKKMNIIRQDDFYKNKTKINDFLIKIWRIFGFGRAKFDRWNPADVWFYTDTALIEINDFLKTCAVNKQEINNLPLNVKKNLAFEDVISLNKLFLQLYKDKKFAPLSLKKSTLYKGVQSYRLGLVNVPQNDMGRPTPPKVTMRMSPISTAKDVVGGVAGSRGRDLKYDIEIDQVEYDEKGRKRFVREYDYVVYNEGSNFKGTTLGVKKIEQFKEAQGGSMGMELTEKILYTAKGAREIKSLRNKVFNKSLSPDIISNGKTVGKDLNNAIEYIYAMARELEPSLKNKKIKFATASQVDEQYKKNKDVIRLIQTKLEIAFGVEKSGIPDEVVLDLWKSITSKGITNRKDHEKLIERIGKGKLNKSKKRGQKRLTQAQADEAARQSVSATIKGNIKKIPGSFHLKLY